MPPWALHSAAYERIFSRMESLRGIFSRSRWSLQGFAALHVRAGAALLLVLIFLAQQGSVAHAQQGNGSIVGRVVDSSGAVITDATINFAPAHYNPVPVAANLAGGAPSVAYSETINAQGGTSPYTFAVTSGALPTGTTLNSSSGVISGTPSAASAFTFTITVTDSLGFTGTQAFQIIIAAPAASGGGSYTFLT